MKIFSIGLIFLFLSSCSFHTGSITTSSVAANGKKYNYVDVALGYSKVSYIFGIGGFGKDMLIDEARRNMYVSYPLKPNETFENVTLNLHTSWYLLYSKKEVVMLADVVARDSSFNVVYGDKYLETISSNKIKVNKHFSLNEKVVFERNQREWFGRIVDFNESSASVFYTDNKGVYRVKDMDLSEIYKLSAQDEFQKAIGFSLGDTISFLNNASDARKVRGVVFGLNERSALVRSGGKLYNLKFIEMEKRQ
jgi:predicted ATPase